MNVYVETNFVFELAFLREERENCDRILSLCEAGRASLVLPAFCIAESYEALIRRAKERKQIGIDVERELQQLRRSEPYRDQIDPLQNTIANLFVQSEVEEGKRLPAVLQRISRTVTLIPLDASIISSASSSPEKSVLKPQDLIVYLSVMRHLAAAGEVESCFIAKDKHFSDNPDLVKTFANQGCKVFRSFSKACQYLEHRCTAGSGT